jgi:enoyl-[acyl-carrier protein] reductase I
VEGTRMGLLDGKKGLVVGIANERSYAWYIAKALADQGAECAFTHLPGEKNERRTRRAVTSILGEQGAEQAWMRPLDASSDAELDAVFDDYAKSFDRMDFLVHSIAFADREWLAAGKFTETPRDAYLGAVDISAYTLAAMAHRARPIMAKSGGGSILCMSYYGGDKVVPGYNVMGVAKAALESSVRYLAGELGEKDIRVNALSAGPLRTLAARGIGDLNSMLRVHAERSALKRNNTVEEVGDAGLFLCSPWSRGITGEVIYCDAGYRIMGL